MSRILIVEDEDKLRHALVAGLREQGYLVAAGEDGERGLQLALSQPADEAFECIILDLMLPGRDGMSVLRELRAAGVTTPAIVLSARGGVDDRVQGLDGGADDYLAKPFAWSELLARIRACLRRGSHTKANVTVGGLTLDCGRRTLLGAAAPIELTIRECEVLEYLARRKGQLVTRDQLAQDVWRDPAAGPTNVVDVYIRYVRKKLERAGAGCVIETIRGSGYRLTE